MAGNRNGLASILAVMEKLYLNLCPLVLELYESIERIYVDKTRDGDGHGRKSDQFFVLMKGIIVAKRCVSFIMLLRETKNGP